MQTCAPQTEENGTALSAWVKALCVTVEQHGLNAEDLCARAGLPHDKLNNPKERIPVRISRKLWDMAVLETQDEALGLKMIKNLHAAHFYTLGYAVLASENLREAFKRMSDFALLVTNSGQLLVEETSDEVRIRLCPDTSSPASLYSIDAFMALLANTCTLLADSDFRFNGIHLQRPEPNAHALPEFKRSFGAPLHFSAAENALALPKRCFEQPLRGGNAAVSGHLDLLNREALEALRPKRLTDDVKRWIQLQLGTKTLTDDIAARHFHMSARTLQRKLAEEGTSFSTLTDQTRSEQAHQALTKTQKPFTAVALDLGFSDASALSRACKRWFGKSPSDLRSNG
jgi:AraC-like DNA-binding protein